MATGTLFPAIYQTVLDQNGKPVSGALVNTYLAGTSTRAATFTDEALSVQSANPIVADAAGRWYAYGTPGASYKFVITNADGSTIGAKGTRDNVSTVPLSSSNLDITGTFGEAVTAGAPVYESDGSGSKTAGSWYLTSSANAYSSTLPNVGFTTAANASGASGTIRLAGQVTGQSSLVLGSTYYLSTAGTISVTAPALNVRAVGVADTTSSLIVKLGTIADAGTWTPVIGGSGGTSGQTYSTQLGIYTKVGPLVVAQFNAVLTAKGTITTNLQIQGLPFAANASAAVSVSYLQFVNLNSNWVNVIATVGQSSTFANVSGAAAAAAANNTALTTADVQNTTQFVGTFIYRAAA